jgi:hypothetical protein
MMDRNLEFLLSEYKDRMQMLQEALAHGNCKDFEEYRYICGQLRGLESACLIITDLEQRMEHSDNE